MTVQLDLQVMIDHPAIPSKAQFETWVRFALKGRISATELTVRLVDEAEMTALNRAYRKKDGPTNVLSFPADLPEEVKAEMPYLGDIIICVPVVISEAAVQQKPIVMHWAHLVIHGVLHLLGYDHQNDEEATKMETIEIELLSQLGYPNPYDTGSKV